MSWEKEKEEKIEALDSWIESTEEELEFAERLYKILDSATTKEDFLTLAKKSLQEHQNPWIKDTLQSILNLVLD